MNLNANKRSIEVDAGAERDRPVLDGLIAWSDVIITNLLPRRRARYGLDWETVHRINPRTILCTAQGFSSHSERADSPCLRRHHSGGFRSSDTYRLRDGSPAYSPYVVADKVCGMTMAQAVLAALYATNATGEGNLGRCAYGRDDVGIHPRRTSRRADLFAAARRCRLVTCAGS
jgi:crotonobetainyl-CoA:carnitine CoA-transferase CaiB-like acyl-CoA transferase